jgi:hypothetical protein
MLCKPSLNSFCCYPLLRIVPVYVPCVCVCVQGKVRLKNVRLKTEALSKLFDNFDLDSDLPINVKAGIVGEIQLEVPWRALNKKPVVRPCVVARERENV